MFYVPLKSEQFCQTISVGGILNDTKFNGFPKLIPELGILTSLLVNVRGCLFCIKIYIGGSAKSMNRIQETSCLHLKRDDKAKSPKNKNTKQQNDTSI